MTAMISSVNIISCACAMQRRRKFWPTKEAWGFVALVEVRVTFPGDFGRHETIQNSCPSLPPKTIGDTRTPSTNKIFIILRKIGSTVRS